MDLEQTNNNLNTKKSFSIIDQLNNIPFIYAFENQLIQNEYRFIKNSPLESGKALLGGEVDMGVIPVTTFAKTKETWRIIPHISISCVNASKNVKLFFKTGLQGLQKIAIDERADSELALLKILLQEKYNITPEYISMKPNLEHMLKSTDAALLIGNEALNEQEINKNSFDLGEEWYDLTGLPMVFSFWVGRETAIHAEDVKNIINSTNLGLKNLENIAKDYAKNFDFSWALYHDYLTQNVNYKFTEKEHTGLTEFYNYAFYYGLIEYIPDILFFEI